MISRSVSVTEHPPETAMGLEPLRLRQNHRHFKDCIFKWIYWNENGVLWFEFQ